MATISIDPVVSAPAAARTPRGWAAYLCLILLWAAVYVPALFGPPLMDDADSAHAEAAREMALHHDFVTLHIDGIRYLEKAPLIYWLVATNFLTFGVTEFSVRLPVVLAVLFAGLLAAAWARRAFGQPAGLFAGIFVYTSFGVFLFTRVLIPDAMLSVFLAAAFYCFLRGLEKDKTAHWLAIYVCLALAVLSKGLVPLVFFFGTLFFYLLITGEWREWKRFRLLSGTLLFLLIAAPWHILAGLRNPAMGNAHGFFWFYFVNEHFKRFLGTRLPKDYNKLPWYLYWGLHMVWLFPWSLFVPLVVRRTIGDWREAWRDRKVALTFRQKTVVLCVIWATLVLVFFSLSTNQEYYTFPAYIALLLLAVGALTTGEEQGQVKSTLWVTGALCVVGTAAAIALFSGLWSSRHLPFVPDIGSVLQRRGVGDYTLSMSDFFDLTGESFAALRLPASLAAITLLVGPLTAFWFARRKRSFAAFGAIALTAAFFLMAAQIALGRFSPYLSSYVLAQQVKAQIQPQDELMLYGDQSSGSSVIFYTRRPELTLLVNGRSTTLEFGSTFSDAPKIFLTDNDLRAHWMGPKRVFLFLAEHDKNKVDAVLTAPQYIIGKSSGKYVISNQPN